MFELWIQMSLSIFCETQVNYGTLEGEMDTDITTEILFRKIWND